MTEQFNIRLPENLITDSKAYAEKFGFSNLQELMKEALREKVYSEVSLEYLQKRVVQAEKGQTFSRKELGF